MNRRFRYSASAVQKLVHNRQHAFALDHTLSVYGANAAYTLIPKNGCSTLRLSIALANGCIDGPERVEWIHLNNKSFPLTTEGAFRADYAFVVIRCPFERLYSAFMDKIVDMQEQTWALYYDSGRRIHPHDLTFRGFVSRIGSVPRHALDIHWRPQVDFLLYDDYDDWFLLDDFAAAGRVLERKIGLKLVDSRPYLKHEISSVRKLEGVSGAADLPAIELLMMKREGSLPDIGSMFDEGTREDATKLYADDVALYREHERLVSPVSLAA